VERAVVFLGGKFDLGGVERESSGGRLPIKIELYMTAGSIKKP
jgi:hypothetical protein